MYAAKKMLVSQEPTHIRRKRHIGNRRHKGEVGMPRKERNTRVPYVMENDIIL